VKYRIEISPPDISAYRKGGSGVEYVHLLDSGKPGPTVMVQALTHGNEFTGAIALDFLFKEKVRPSKGKLILAFANVAAFARFDFDDPDRSRYIDEDYNRVWGDDALLGSRDSAELRRARELRPSWTPPITCSTCIRCTNPAGRSWSADRVQKAARKVPPTPGASARPRTC